MKFKYQWNKALICNIINKINKIYVICRSYYEIINKKK